MPEKPTYEELEKRVKELEKETVEREQVEEALRESEEKYRTLFKNANEAIYVAQDERIVFANPKTEELYGYSAEQLTSKPFINFIHDKDQKIVLDRYKRRLRGEKLPTTYPFRIVNKAGDTKWVELKVAPFSWDNRPATLCFLTDITERKLTEEALQKAHDELERRVEERTAELARTNEQLKLELNERKRAEDALAEERNLLRTVIDNLPDYIYVKDTESRYVVSNNPHVRFLGATTPDEVIGKTVFELFPQELAAQYYADDQELIQSGQPLLNKEEYSIDKTGKRIWNLTSKVPLRDSSGKIVGLVGIAADITERKKAGEALQESEEKYKTLTNNLNAAVYRVSPGPKGRFLEANPAYLKIYGYESREELLKSDVRDLYQDPADRKKFSEKMQRDGFVRNEELRLKRKDGTPFIGSVSAVAVKDENGEVKYFDCFQEDITKRIQAEEALRESEEKYRTILESIEDAYFEVDIRGNFTFFNDSLCKIMGYPRDELMGMNNRQYMDQENANKVYQTFNKVYTTGKPEKGVDWEFIRKDGTKGYVETSVSLMKDAEGNQVGFRGIIRDITDRKQMEAELIQTKDFLENILDSSIDGITTTDLQGNVIYTSPRTRDILGYRKEKIIGKKVHSFYGNGVEDAKAIMEKLTEKGELRDHEMKLIRKDGELVDINLSASLLKDEKGEVIGTLGIYRDITEKNRLEAQLAQAQRMEAIGTLAGGMAHNFNNLLMAIQGNASLMLLETDSTHPNHERLKSIEKSVQSGSRLTRQLLGYAREGRYEVRPISLNQVVEETSYTFGTTKKEITVHRELAKDLCGIKADQGQIEQALLNLYVNAADAMPGGGDLFLKTMNVTHKDMRAKSYKPKPGNYVLLTITDTGTGMDKKTMERIFDPFFTTKGLAKGTGLGLASVYGIVKAHGGYIDVDSKKGHARPASEFRNSETRLTPAERDDGGQGTTFSIYLPASEKRVEKPVKSAGHIIEGTGIILLVDDEEMVLGVGAQLLNNLGYTALEAKGGREAVEIYKANKDKIDMVILDMIMPGVGGGEAYDRMKEINPTIKVLLSSGYSIDGQATEILERGCDGFIQKPFNMKQLSRSIREILDKQ